MKKMKAMIQGIITGVAIFLLIVSLINEWGFLILISSFFVGAMITHIFIKLDELK